jgi:hypothetical protein
MRLMSVNSVVVMPGRPITTPSTTKATLGSAAGENDWVPMPRIASVEFEFVEPRLKETDGTSCPRLSALRMPSSASVEPLITVTAAGTSCSGSRRFSAVTTTSASCAAWVESAALAVAADCAKLGREMSEADRNSRPERKYVMETPLANTVLCLI